MEHLIRGCVISLLLLLFTLSITFNLKAESYILLQNNTSLPLWVTTSLQSSTVLSDDAWWGKEGIIPAWQPETNVLWTNRNVGIKNGNNYYFTIGIYTDTDTIEFKVWLHGLVLGSRMKFALNTKDTNKSWHSNNEFHDVDFMLNGKKMTAKFAACNTRAANSDILLAIHEHQPYPANPVDLINPDIINVLSYNVFLLKPPIAFTHQQRRASVLPQQVHGYDAIIFNEVFYNAARDILLQGLSFEYPYQTKVLDKNGSLFSGGVVIVSRWPIEATNQHIYSNCVGEDCFAAKGVMYAKINKLGRNYHLFGTHAQAGRSKKRIAARQLQLEELYQFVSQQNIPLSEAVLIGGDLNVDRVKNNSDEYCKMLEVVSVQEPFYELNKYTFNGKDNYYCSDDYRVSYLDYIFPHKSFLKPLKATNEVRVFRTIEDKLWRIFDLSDHFSVYGKFVFAPAAVGQTNQEVDNPVLQVASAPPASTESILNKLSAYLATIQSSGDTTFANMLHNLYYYAKLYQQNLVANAGSYIDTEALKKQATFMSQQGRTLIQVQPATLFPGTTRKK